MTLVSWIERAARDGKNKGEMGWLHLYVCIYVAKLQIQYSTYNYIRTYVCTYICNFTEVLCDDGTGAPCAIVLHAMRSGIDLSTKAISEESNHYRK